MAGSDAPTQVRPQLPQFCGYSCSLATLQVLERARQRGLKLEWDTDRERLDDRDRRQQMEIIRGLPFSLRVKRALRSVTRPRTRLVMTSLSFSPADKLFLLLVTKFGKNTHKCIKQMSNSLEQKETVGTTANPVGLPGNAVCFGCEESPVNSAFLS